MTYAQQVKLERLRAEVKKAYLEWLNSTGKDIDKKAKKWLDANGKLYLFVERIDN